MVLEEASTAPPFSSPTLPGAGPCGLQFPLCKQCGVSSCLGRLTNVFFTLSDIVTTAYVKIPTLASLMSDIKDFAIIYEITNFNIRKVLSQISCFLLILFLPLAFIQTLLLNYVCLTNLSLGRHIRTVAYLSDCATTPYSF